ncbi:MAG: glycosyltransferase family 4 protein [Steroidobacteraceae bacterium]
MSHSPESIFKAPKLRVLIVSSDTYPPKRVDVAVLFGEELSGRGHHFDWILQSEAACSRSYVVDWGGGSVWVGATDLGSSLLSRIRKHTRGIIHDLRLIPLLRKTHYDFIEVKDKFISGIIALIAARLYHRKFVFWLSYPFGEDYLLRAKDGTARYPILYFIRGAVSKALLYKLLLRSADHVFVQSEQMRRDVGREGIPLEKITAVPMGIKPSTFSRSVDGADRVLIPRGVPCFLYLGTLGKVRRLDFLVRVLALVREKLPGVMLYFIGGSDDPGDASALVQEARRLGVGDAVVMVGQLPQSEALRYVQEADVCVSPFFPTPVLNSTSPTKLVEYMGMGKAVVANDHPEQRLVIEQSGAGYCVPYEEAAFAAAIIELLKSPDTAALMGKRGHEYVIAQRSYARIADRVEETFGLIAAERGK